MSQERRGHEDLTRLVTDGWHFDPSVGAFVALVAMLYVVGARRSRLRKTGPEVGRMGAFFAGLLIVVVALEASIDGLSERYFWIHMLQHELLLVIAPSLLLLGKPLPTIWRAVPLDARRATARRIVKSRRVQGAWGATGSLALGPGGVADVHNDPRALAPSLTYMT